MNGVSIIMPTYDNVEYIEDTLNSIYESVEGFEYEILIGIDACEKTLRHILKNSYPSEVRFFFFSKNRGPYLIKNTLSKISKYDTIIFFDSDDLMLKPMVSRCVESLKRFHFIKPKLTNFEIIGLKMVEKKNRREWGEGVFAIRKEVFLKFNGFEPWPVAADSDFMKRLYKNNVPFEMSNDVLMLRRIHSKGLTNKPETGMRSILRNKYATLLRLKKDFTPLKELVVSNFVEITEVKKTELISKKNIVDIKNVLKIELNENEILKLKSEKTLHDVLNKKVLPIIIPNTNTEKKQTIISDNPILRLLNKTNKGVEKQSITEQRNNLTIIKQKSKKDINNILNPRKPNRRLDLPNIRI